MKKLSFILCISIISIFLVSCSKDEQEEVKGKFPKKISGLVEKGPFASGSSVSLYELDENLNGTGRVFEGKTNDEGYFEINSSADLVSKYIKLSVSGFYFNEVTGGLSNAPIVLEAITTVDESETAKINVNVLTHLEMPRVMSLVTKDKKSFEQAKQQASKELLTGFLITDEISKPEQTSITTNTKDANILIAISSILLNNRSDAEFSEFMSFLRTDLTDGVLSDVSKSKIKESSYKLDYVRVKKHVVKRYKDLGKDVEIGGFQLYIDGDGDGQIGTDYEIDSGTNVAPEDIFATEEGFKTVLAASLIWTNIYIKNNYLFDAVYSNNISKDKLESYYDLKDVYNHQVASYLYIVRALWNDAYRNIVADNMLIDRSEKVEGGKFKKYKYPALVLRAYKYLSIVELWGDVPLTIVPATNGTYLSRTAKEQVLEQIITDLKEAEQSLPEVSQDNFCSKYFATALLARTYLFKKDYANALVYANKIIASGKFSLQADYNSIFAKSNSETIFSIPTETQEPNPYFDNLIKKGDYISLSRYAEILLIAAEANLKQGNLQKSREYINLVRTRNNKSALATSTATAEVQEALLAEWKEDLKYEGLWFSTLKRFDLAESTLNIEPFKKLLPIPQTELDVNPNMVQNPGY